MDRSQAEKKIKELSSEIEMHNHNYYVNDAPTISDFEFDKLLESLIEVEKQFPDLILPTSPSQRVGGTITKEFKTVKHKYPMLSLSNSYSTEDMIDFDRKVQEGLGLQQNDLFASGAVKYVCE